MQQSKHLFENSYKRVSGNLLILFILTVKPLLNNLYVPVTEFISDKIVCTLTGQSQVISLHGIGNISDRIVQPAEYPLIFVPDISVNGNIVAAGHTWQSVQHLAKGRKSPFPSCRFIITNLDAFQSLLAKFLADSAFPPEISYHYPV